MLDGFENGDLIEFDPRDHIIGVRHYWRKGHVERPHAWCGKHVEPAVWLWEDKKGSRCMYVTKVRHRK